MILNGTNNLSSHKVTPSADIRISLLLLIKWGCFFSKKLPITRLLNGGWRKLAYTNCFGERVESAYHARVISFLFLPRLTPDLHDEAISLRFPSVELKSTDGGVELVFRALRFDDSGSSNRF